MNYNESYQSKLIVGYVEPNQLLATQVADRRQLDKSLIFADLEEMLAKTHPQAVVTGQIKADEPSSLEINMIATEILDAARKSAATGTAVTLSREK